MASSQGSTTKYKCTQPDCNKKYKRRPDLQRHERDNHEPPYTCLVPVCFRDIKRRDKFIAHMMDCHRCSREYAISILEEARAFTAYSSIETPGDVNINQYPQATTLQQRGPIPINSHLEHITTQTQQPQSTAVGGVNINNQMIAHDPFVARPLDDIIIYTQNATSMGLQGNFSPSATSTVPYDILSGFPEHVNSNSIETPNSTDNFYGLAPFENEMLDNGSVHFG